MTIDGHAHLFPSLGDATAGPAGRLHLKLLQHHVQGHPQGFRRLSDGSAVTPSPLMPAGDLLEEMVEADFRVGGHGRLECTVDGVDYFLQWLAPKMTELAATPEALVAQMDYVGVDCAVIQHDHVYGRLDDYLARCVRQYPGRFLPLAQVDEWAFAADPGASTAVDSELQRVERQLDSGCVGLYFSVESLAVADYRYALVDAAFAPLWQLLEQRGVPVFWYLFTAQRDRYAGYMEQVGRLTRWARAHPRMTAVYTHGVESIVLRERANRFEIPQQIVDCCRLPNVHLELMLHLMAPDTTYPFDWAPAIVRHLRDELGAESLIWGSDMPAAERQCTYQQSIDYVAKHCPFLSASERSLFFGGNLQRLLGSPR